MTTTKDGMGIAKVTTEEAMQDITVGDVPEGVEIVAKILKSPHMPRPKKDKQEMASVHMFL